MAQATQSGRQAGAHLPHGEGSNLSQAGSQVVTSQAGAHLPSGEGSNLSQAGALFPLGKEAVYLRQAVRQMLTFPLGKEEVYLRQSVRQALTFLLGNKSTRQAPDGGTTGAQLVTNEVKNKGHIVIPYTQGLCESIKKICGRYGIQPHFKGGRTIKSLLVSP